MQRLLILTLLAAMFVTAQGIASPYPGPTEDDRWPLQSFAVPNQRMHACTAAETPLGGQQNEQRDGRAARTSHSGSTWQREGPHEDSHESAHGKFSSAHGKFSSAHGNVHESVLGQFSHVLFSHVLFLGHMGAKNARGKNDVWDVPEILKGLEALKLKWDQLKGNLVAWG